MIDFYDLPKDDYKTWELLATGKTAGIFQLDNENLGGRFSRKIQPKSISDIAAITTIIRPGTLNAEMEDGESAAIHYERRHRKVEPVESFHVLLDQILGDTQQIILYQEQTIKIAKELAGFTGAQAMKLMKGIGKKKAELIMALEKDFVEGCVKNNIVKEDAQKIFDVIKKSARYSFNKSHAVAYSEISYCDAYAKANHMTTFYVASLRMARHKTQSKIQIKKLVKEAATFGIICKPPRLDNCYVDFTENGGQIYFGISNIKGIGEKKAQQIVDIAPGPDTWYKCLFNLLSVGKAVAANCILAGVFAKYKVPVRRQIDDLNNLSLLSVGEKNYAIQVFNNFDNFVDLLRHVKVTKATTKRQDKLDSIIKLMDKPPEELQDNLRDTTQNEVALFGCTISYDNIDTVHASGNCSVNDYNEGKDLKLYQMVVEVERAKTHEITKGASEGKLMCFLSVFDHSGKMDVTLFDTAYDEFGGMLYEGSTIMIKGKRGRRKGLIVDEVLQII